MPVYMVHGFKWERTPIREYVIIHNVYDAAPDYLMSPTTPEALIKSLRKSYPGIMKKIPAIHFIERYDPMDTGPNAGSQPYAFVADRVIEVDLSINIREAQEQNAINPKDWESFAQLKEKLAGRDAEFGWFVVYNGDPLRGRDPDSDYEDSDEEASGGEMETEEMEAEEVDKGKGKENAFKRIYKRISSNSKDSSSTRKPSTG
ncbi:hypothetical protein ACLMJK_007464 [Lecanora helva]